MKHGLNRTESSIITKESGFIIKLFKPLYEYEGLNPWMELIHRLVNLSARSGYVLSRQ